MGNIKKPAAMLRRVLAVALGDIQRDRRGCPVQLIFDVTDSHRSVQERREPCNEANRFLIDFQSFMIEAVFFGRVHEVRLLILIALLILFLLLIFLLIFLFIGSESSGRGQQLSGTWETWVVLPVEVACPQRIAVDCRRLPSIAVEGA